MTTVLEQPKNQISPINYGVIKEELANKVAADLLITISGIEDKEGYKLADTRRKEYVKLRNAIDKKRKDLNAEARQHIERVNVAAEELQAIISEGETHVTQLVDDVDATIAKAKQDKIDAAFNAINDRLIAVGLIHPRVYVETLADADIEELIGQKLETDRLKKEEAERQAAAKIEQDRLAAEEKERNRVESEKLAAERAEFARQKAEQDAETARLKKIEDDKLAAERAELDRQRADQQEAQRKLDTEREAIHKAEQDRLDAIERARLEAEQKESARVAEEQRVAREAEEARLKAEQAEADRKASAEREVNEKARLEALRPDREKLLAYVAQIDAIELPQVSKSMTGMKEEVRLQMTHATNAIRDLINGV